MKPAPDRTELLAQLRCASRVRKQEAISLHLSQNDCELIADDIERLTAALGTIERMCSEEITARFGGHHSKTEEELAGKSVIYSMLVLPRNIARSAIAADHP